MMVVDFRFCLLFGRKRSSPGCDDAIRSSQIKNDVCILQYVRSFVVTPLI